MEQAARAIVGFVESLGIGIEEMAELLARRCRDPKGFKNPWDLNPDQQMKMVSQQAIGEGIGDGFDIFGVQLHEVGVVALFAEDVFAVVAAVVDVVGAFVLQWERLGHGCSSFY